MKDFRINLAGEGKSGVLVSTDTEDDIEYVRIDHEDCKNAYVLITVEELDEIHRRVHEED